MLGQIGAIILIAGTSLLGILALLLALYGLMIAFNAIGHILAASGSRRWIEVKGQVSTSQVVEIKPRRKFPFSDARIFAPQLQYSYAPERQEITGQQLNFDPIPSFFMPIAGFEQRASQQIVERFPAGTEVAVYYDPNDINKAVLERSTPNTTIYVVTGLLLVFIGSAGALVCWELLKSFLNF
ncbi:MAG: DUF3592 domain-containing protein [Chloroflexi bacterium]|nr:DUF3592 domain-containing protein [Chloroflexota bacterium]